MALKATIFKCDLSITDMDRNYFENHTLTLARHPSENDARLMVRLLAYMLFADERLEFGKGLSTDEEPDLWLKDMTGAIERWIYVGQLDERWLRKAAGRARRVVVLSYGDRAVDAWWEQNRSTLEKLSNLTVLRISADELQALAGLAERSMNLQCTIQDGEAMISGPGDAVNVVPVVLFRAGE